MQKGNVGRELEIGASFRFEGQDWIVALSCTADASCDDG